MNILPRLYLIPSSLIKRSVYVKMSLLEATETIEWLGASFILFFLALCVSLVLGVTSLDSVGEDVEGIIELKLRRVVDSSISDKNTLLCLGTIA